VFRSTHGSFLSLGLVDRAVYIKPYKPHDVHVMQVITALAQTDAAVAKVRNEALEKYQRTPNDYDMAGPLCVYAAQSPQGRIDLGAFALREYLFQKIGTCKYLSLDEAVELIEEKNSSPGWPFTQKWETRGQLLKSGVLKSLIDSWWESGLHAVWTGCLKDEVVKIEKVKHGLVRFFFCCPMPVQVRLMQFGGVLNKRVIELSKKFMFPTYLGVSSYDRNWHVLFSRFRGKKHFFSLDETNYDSTISVRLLAALYDIRNSLLDVPVSDNHLRRLIQEIAETVVVTDTGHLIQKRQGNPSGSPNTSADNSLILIMLYFEAYFRVYPTDSLFDFEAHVSLVVIGDDNFCGVDEARSLFTENSVMSVMTEWGISPKVEAVSDTLEGMEFVSKIIKSVETCSGPVYVPMPKQVRFVAHLLMSTPGEDALLSAVKVNALMSECPFDDLLWKMCVSCQDYYRKRPQLLAEWEDDSLTRKTWLATLLSREFAKERFLYGRKECGYMCKYNPHKKLKMPKKNGKKKNLAARKSVKTSLQPKARPVVAMARGAASSSALGSLIGKAANFAEKMPVIGNMVEKVDSVASSILGFLGMGSSLFSVHYDVNGRQRLSLHRNVRDESDEKMLRLTAGETVEAGAIVMKYSISIGPEGSRSRAMGSLYEKVKFHGFQLTVNPTCAATTSGSLAYLYVPDPSDTTLDDMTNSERLSALCSRENVQFAQIWQSTVLRFALPPREFYVKFSDSVERLTSPGAVYVISMTSLDPAYLPTLRQTTAFTFAKPTNAPPAEKMEVALLSNSCQIGEGGTVNYWRCGYEFTSIVPFDANRILSTNYTTQLQAVTHYLRKTILIKKGEVCYVATPSALVNGTPIDPISIEPPVWLPHVNAEKPGHPRYWTNPLTLGGIATPQNVNYLFNSANCTAFHGYWYKLVAEQDSELVFAGPGSAPSTSELCYGSVLVIIDKSGVTDPFSMTDVSNLTRSEGRVTLLRNKPALPRQIRMVDDFVNVPATPSVKALVPAPVQTRGR